MPKVKPKPLGPVGNRMGAAVFNIDALAYLATTLSLQGKCCPHFAQMLTEGAKENHGAALGVCEHLGYEPPAQPKGRPGGGGK